GLQAQLALSDRGQIALLLILASVTKQRAHGVHLGMTYRRVASRAVDLFQNNAGFRDPQARSSILFRYQSSEIPALGERVHKFLRILLVLINVSPVPVWKILAKPAYLFANGLPRFLYRGG